MNTSHPKLNIDIISTRILSAAGSRRVRAQCSLSLHLGRRHATGTITLRGTRNGEALEFDTWWFCDSLEAALEPFYALDEDSGQGISNAIVDHVYAACLGQIAA